MRFYISGPISGRMWVDALRDFGVAESEVIEHKQDVVNPMDASLWGLSWETYMRIATSIIESGEIDCMLMLPGWENSNGATIEHMWARTNGIPVAYRKPNGKYVLGGGYGNT